MLLPKRLMMRPSLDEVMLRIAQTLSMRATCIKRKVGCVLTDAHGRILSTGYNGVAASLPHCTRFPCDGANKQAGSDTCQAVHAEINALIFCHDSDKIHTCYTTVLPCNNCLKSLLNTPCKHLVYLEEHEQADFILSNWTRAGRTVQKYDTLNNLGK